MSKESSNISRLKVIPPEIECVDTAKFQDLIDQMSVMRNRILEALRRDFRNTRNRFDPKSGVGFVLETGEIGDSGDIFKQCKHIESGCVFVFRLTPDGKLFLPEMPEEWGELRFGV